MKAFHAWDNLLGHSHAKLGETHITKILSHQHIPGDFAQFSLTDLYPLELGEGTDKHYEIIISI